MVVPPIITEDDFHAVQRQLRSRNPMVMPPRAVSGPILLTGICFCPSCAGAMTLRTGRGSAGGVYRYYTCSTKARQGSAGCKGMAVRMDLLDQAVINFLTSDLLDSTRLEALLAPWLTQHDAWAERRRNHVIDLRERALAAETKLRHLYDAVENGMLTGIDSLFKERVAELTAIREQADLDADRVAAMVDRTGPVLTVQDLHGMAEKARSTLLTADRSFHRPRASALLQRVEVVSKHDAHVKGSRIELLRALATVSGSKVTLAGYSALNLTTRAAGDPGERYMLSLSF